MKYPMNGRHFYCWMISISLWMNTYYVKSEDLTTTEREECAAETCTSKIEEECHDLHELCHGWASVGECVINPNYMRSACRRSCALCYDERYLSEFTQDKETMYVGRSYLNCSVGSSVIDNTFFLKKKL
jgi:hypothetical protein